ncbi:hypothetical protein BCV70DRAFT_89212 [Testicularia cyperi]|uniref:Secreted protein n=1 Tax=Testicularia cyperi TaxID=1882483 RepID=A0A317XUM3_9BASI|nr:hypothetical protein BCV70DRAFT_89212 [Testicularia cyperi]
MRAARMSISAFVFFSFFPLLVACHLNSSPIDSATTQALRMYAATTQLLCALILQLFSQPIALETSSTGCLADRSGCLPSRSTRTRSGTKQLGRTGLCASHKKKAQKKRCCLVACPLSSDQRLFLTFLSTLSGQRGPSEDPSQQDLTAASYYSDLTLRWHRLA